MDVEVDMAEARGYRSGCSAVRAGSEGYIAVTRVAGGEWSCRRRCEQASTLRAGAGRRWHGERRGRLDRDGRGGAGWGAAAGWRETCGS